VLFAGSRVPRRQAFFAWAAPRLSKHFCFVRLVDDAHYLRAGRSAPSQTRALLGLAQRSKTVLNIHRGESDYFEGHRIALHGLGQGALVLTEPVGAVPPFRPGKDYVEASLREFPEALDYHLRSAQGRKEAERIAANGLRTFRGAGRLAPVLARAAVRLGPPRRAAASRERLRVETAAALLSGRPAAP
jgi:hypothetical protein